MSPLAKQESSSCANGCDNCSLMPPQSKEPPPFSGVRFGLLSLAFFIFPIVTALIGSRIFAGATAGPGTLGALGGLALGMAGAAFFARRVAPKRSIRQEDCHE